jgi:hypothetical protein
MSYTVLYFRKEFDWVMKKITHRKNSVINSENSRFERDTYKQREKQYAIIRILPKEVGVSLRE